MAKPFKVATGVGYVVASLIIIFALLVSVGRLLTPYLNDHLPNFEAWATQVLKVPIKIKHVEISWNVYEPEIAFQEVKVLNKQSLKPQFTVREIKVNLNFVKSLWTWTPVTENIKIRGAHLTLVKTAKGLPLIEELKGLSITDNSTEGSSHLSDILVWIFTQPRLVLREIDITYKEDPEPPKHIFLNRLILTNNAHHELFGDAILQQTLPLHVQTHLDWKGNVADLDHVSADLYLYAEGLSLSQWLSKYTWKNLQVQEGLGSAKIWLTWANNQLQEVQSQFQFYDLTIHSLQTKKTLTLPRLSGHVGWKKDRGHDIFAGNDVLIDLPNHLWPITQFQFIFSKDQAGIQKLKSLQMGYVDLMDVSEIGFASGLIPQNIQDKLTALHPQGEIRNLTLIMPAKSNEDISLVGLGFNFSNLSFNAWQSYPGLIGAQGRASW